MIIPQHGRVLIRNVEKEDIEKMNGIYIPGNQIEEEDLLHGVVENDSEFYAKGTKVFYSKFSAVTIKNSKDLKGRYHLVHQGDVLAIDDTK